MYNYRLFKDKQLIGYIKNMLYKPNSVNISNISKRG